MQTTRTVHFRRDGGALGDLQQYLEAQPVDADDEQQQQPVAVVHLDQLAKLDADTSLQIGRKVVVERQAVLRDELGSQQMVPIAMRHKIQQS
jgi:hypothetical protein